MNRHHVFQGSERIPKMKFKQYSSSFQAAFKQHSSSTQAALKQHSSKKVL
jgi:hypothetical protein